MSDIDWLALTDAQIYAEEHRGQLRIAERVVREHGHNLRYVANLGWHVWDGTRWAEDDDGEPARRVIATLKGALRDAVRLDKPERDELHADIRKAESSAGLLGALALAGLHRPIALSHSRLDVNAHLLNTPSGTLDLRTGAIRAHNREDHITMRTGAPITDRPSPRWEAFLATVLPDKEVRGYVQRLMGLALLGEVREHVMPIFTGDGANGKGTFRTVMLRVFGDYATEVGPELLMETKHERHGTFKMELRGRRLVFCSETEKDRRFAEATMKRLVGGDPIQGNRMHKDPITFEPSHTLIMVTNHLPRVSGDDPAVWRRIHVVPWDVVLDESEQDPEMPEKLVADAPAILRWVLDGWDAYKEIGGLAPPAAIQARTAQYKGESDVIGRFLDERCMANPHATVKARELYTEYVKWCRASGEHEITETLFGRTMTTRGQNRIKTHGVMVYRGLGLYAEDGDLS